VMGFKTASFKFRETEKEVTYISHQVKARAG
jgi:hypothetical protein